MDTLTQLLGKLHPVVLHFPLVLILLGAAAECARWSGRAPRFAAAAGWLLGLAALSALIATGTGWLLAAREHIRSDQREALAWHRWLGVSTAVVSCVTWLLSVKREATASQRDTLRVVLALAAAGLVLFVGYFGGELVWGPDWFQLNETHQHE
jgi:uncharacterized membrane protein